MTPSIDQLEPPTKEQWQQMRQDYEDWLKEYASATSLPNYLVDPDKTREAQMKVTTR